MTIKITKDTKWSQFDNSVRDEYYVWADNRCVALYQTEEQARNAVEKIKATYVSPITVTIFEETIQPCFFGYQTKQHTLLQIQKMLQQQLIIYI